jgi:purine-cytosine permease-like protein
VRARHRPGTGGWPAFWLGVDLVIVMPVSWLPLVADFNRFAKRGSRSALGTFAGYFVGNVWFYALGALLILAVAGAGVVLSVDGIGAALLPITGGALLLVVLLVGETDEAFANLYSSAVSLQNVAPRASQRKLIAGVAVAAFALAWFLSIETYEVFLFLIGSVFVPLFGVFAADYFVLRNSRFDAEELFAEDGTYWYRAGVRWMALVPWVAGFVVFHWSAPVGPDGWKRAVESVFHALHLPFPLFGSEIGASIPAFATAFLLSEIADFAVYTPLARRRLVIAVVASSIAGLIVDSIVFLWLAFGSLEFLLGQIVGKLWMVLLAVPFVAYLRRRDEQLGLKTA